MVCCISPGKMEKLLRCFVSQNYTKYEYEGRLQTLLSKKSRLSACGNYHHSIDLISEVIINVTDQYGGFCCLFRSRLPARL